MIFKLLFIFLIGRCLKELECGWGRGKKGTGRVPGTWHILKKQVEDSVFVLPRLTWGLNDGKLKHRWVLTSWALNVTWSLCADLRAAASAPWAIILNTMTISITVNYILRQKLTFLRILQSNPSHVPLPLTDATVVTDSRAGRPKPPNWKLKWAERRRPSRPPKCSSVSSTESTSAGTLRCAGRWGWGVTEREAPFKTHKTRSVMYSLRKGNRRTVAVHVELAEGQRCRRSWP